ncbi:hypothetical protein [Legionella tunisiensis]|uniref:hypothetical protein n=1 Tax=Legionella tunisiensis TaxID=1034944 RepID=UPI00031BE6B9|nr:hypothetical protein [Legionella tunisiensis]
MKCLSGEIKPAEDSTSNKLLQDKGYEHEKNYLQSLKDNAKVIFEISKDQPSEVRTRQTTDALQSGPEIIYQARLTDTPWHGDADFLIKTNTPSKLGAFSYEVLDTKLSRSHEPKHIMQLCVYSDLLEKVQGVRPKLMHLVLGDGSHVKFNVDDFFIITRRLSNDLNPMQIIHLPTLIQSLALIAFYVIGVIVAQSFGKMMII